MILTQRDGLRYYSFKILDHSSLTQAIFTRLGGVSPIPWKSLNMGGMVGDDPKRVEENRKLAFQIVGRNPESMYDVWQVHSDKVVCADNPRLVGVDYLRADAILTDNPGVTIFMRFADCVPVFLFDPNNRVVGLVHAGWRGTVKKIVKSAVQSMIQLYGCNTKDIRAGIGPSISAPRYLVGPEVEKSIREAFGVDSKRILNYGNRQVRLDLWEANRILLEEEGLVEIEISGICTASNLDEWFSYRGESQRTGRFGALIGLNK